MIELEKIQSKYFLRTYYYGVAVKYILVLLFLFPSVLSSNSLFLIFQGNEHINERELYEALGLYKPYGYEFWKKEPTVDSDVASLVGETLKSFYRSKGLYHTTVTHYENNTSIHIIIDEKKPVRVADITSSSILDIQSYIPFNKETIFDADKFDKSKKSIQLLYAENGYCNAKLESKAWVDIETDLAYLMYDVVEGEICYFGPIEIDPPENIDSKIIRSLLYIKEKELYSPEDIRRSYKSLYGYEGISKAIIDTNIHNDNIVPIKVTVSENENQIRFQTGIGASSDEGAVALLGVKHRNLFKDLKTLSLSTRLTQIKKTIKSNFDMPLKHRNSTGVEIGFENEKFLGFNEERVFGSIYLKQREIPYMFQESLVFDNSITYDSEDALLFPEGKLFVLSPKLQWVYDTRNNLLDPSKGHFLRADLMGSLQSDISDASYYKYMLTGGYIIPIDTSILALKVDFGSLRIFDGRIPPSYRFYTGGMKSNRAYSYRELGPVNAQNDPIGSDSVLETTVEYRFPLYGDFKGVVFNDNTFLGSNNIPDYDQGYYSAGLGIRYLTPIGPIAIDFGFDIEDPQEQYAFHFHIGELF